MRVPFPTIDGELAVSSHMYICIQEGVNKQFVKCQTFKPLHLVPDKLPYKFIREVPDITRNPFKKITTIDCDKSFCMDNVTISPKLLTASRHDVCGELFNNVETTTGHGDFQQATIQPGPLMQLNRLIQSSP